MIHRSLTHMAWANQQVIGKISELPTVALEAYVVNPEWTVGTIVRHIASASNWYVWRLLDKSNFTEVENAHWKKRLADADEESSVMQDLTKVLEILQLSDSELVKQSLLPDGDVAREFDGDQHVFSRSTILSQAVHHATEHRAQAVAALESRGFSSVNLDNYDLWNFSIKVGK